MIFHSFSCKSYSLIGLLFLALLFHGHLAFGQEVDIQLYHLSVDFDLENKAISGSNEIHFTKRWFLKKFMLQLDSNLSVLKVEQKIKNKWKPIVYTRNGNSLALDILNKDDSKGILKIYYSGKPKEATNPPWEGGISWKNTTDGKPWIGITCQVQGASLWWPCIDDWAVRPDSMRLDFTIPNDLICVSNGTLLAKKEVENSSTYSWGVSGPIPPYSVSVNIGPFEKIEQTYTSVDSTPFSIELWNLPEHREKALAFFEQIPKQLEFLENILGPYPFRQEKYAVVESPFIGMEHQTVVSIDSLYRSNYAGFHWVHFHELAHQWWGNKVTASWEDFWIHEGFAQYMEALYVEELKGSKHYCNFIQSYHSRLLNLDPIAHKTRKTGPEAFYSSSDSNLINRDYSIKGTYFLHLLRYELGDKAFFKFLNAVYEYGLSKQLTTAAVLTILENQSNRSFTDFFEAFLYQGNLPEELTFTKTDCIVSSNDSIEALHHMVGQMLLIGFSGTQLKDNATLSELIRKGQIGGVVLYERNIDASRPKESLTNLITEMQKWAPMPLLISIDEEGGKVNRLKTKYGFVPTLSAKKLGEINDLDTLEKYVDDQAKQLQELGINVNFAPVLDLCSNSKNPVIYKLDRCYSDDPETVGRIGAKIIAIHEHYGVLAVPKHFPGHGSSEHDSHLGITDVTRLWKSSELTPYKMIIANDSCRAIMTAHIINRKLDTLTIPSTFSKKTNTDLLRDSLGFRGLIFSDDLQMRAISDHYSMEEVLTQTINSGVDVLMISHNIAGTSDHSIEDIHNLIVNLVQQGKIPRKRIEHSYQRIKQEKLRLPIKGNL